MGIVSSMDEQLKEIIERVNIILSEKELLEDKTLDKEKLNDVLSKSKEKVTDFVNDFIYKGLKDKTPKEEMINIINNFCNALKEIEATSCADYLKPLLINKLNKDFGKSILRLKFEHFQVLIYSLIFIVAIIGYKFYNSYDTTYPILSVRGLNNAISISKKIDRHDSILGVKSHVKGSGWGKLILSWPFKPSDDEIKYYTDYIADLRYVIVALAEDNKICKSEHWTDVKDVDKVIKDVNKINDFIAEEIKSVPLDASNEDIFLLLYIATQKTFPCNNE